MLLPDTGVVRVIGPGKGPGVQVLPGRIRVD